MGRPSTSGYCHTCRKRRIKCDRKRPSCSQCLKSRYHCRGYDLGLRMHSLVVITDSKGGHRLARAASSETKPPDDTGDDNNFQKRNNGDSIGQKRQVVHFPRGPTRGMSLVAFQDKVAISYFYSSYRWAGLWKPFIESLYDHDFDTAGRSGILALVYGHMGRTHGSVSLRVQGQELYGRCMSQVQSQLNQSGQLRKSQVARIAMPVMLMAMYSLAIDKDSRMVHHLGMARILQYCGPQAFQEEPLLSTFRGVRAHLICQALAHSQRTFLEEEQWKTLPFSKGKTCRDELLDIVASIPGIMQDMKISAQTRSSPTIPRLHPKLRGTIERLHQWRSAWGCEDQTTNQLYPPITSSQHVVVNDLSAPSLKFSALSQALTLLTYRAALIYLTQLETILGIRGLLDESLPHNTGGANWYVVTTQPCEMSNQPSKTQSLLQPAMKGSVLFSCLRDNLLSGEDRVMIALFPIGTVYWALCNQPMITETVLAGWTSLSDAALGLSVHGSDIAEKTKSLNTL